MIKRFHQRLTGWYLSHGDSWQVIMAMDEWWNLVRDVGGLTCWKHDLIAGTSRFMMFFLGRIHWNNWALLRAPLCLVPELPTSWSNCSDNTPPCHWVWYASLVEWDVSSAETFCRMCCVAAWLLSVKANCFLVGMVTGTICYHPRASSFGGGATRVQDFDPPTILTLDLEDEHIWRA